ncbi:helix-turn-helix domain-containing protein [Brevibacterium aurantiacum]|uniref:DNA-binding transcriptional regulator, MerR family n=1 Tax=Brevibacterium aurantiacum TaxID=273384 RepID=A0A2H1J8B8_BREAU|nr:MerR family transcriptional regulator [Brevibacterium aurantiacum]SMX83432.1 DNA-binding transcriptional regulator, MerR family [Brevibacterium aurantiacum]SMX99868.1 DNA-binding transcriptional regulator, MerR family [Brevibacterium aurantiacum]
MGWSTSELARLTDTTVNTIRHYHKQGLLSEPERASNGYKQYGAAHLLRLLQIRRLRSLGIPLEKISSIDGDQEVQRRALKDLDAELKTKIAELEKTRDEVAGLIEHGAPIDTASGFSDVAATMSEADRRLMGLYARLYDDETMTQMRGIMAETSPADREFNELPDDADEAARVHAVDAMVPLMEKHLDDDPWLLDIRPSVEGAAEDLGWSAIMESMVELYNPAQLDVLGRAIIRVHKERVEETAADDDAKESGTE